MAESLPESGAGGADSRNGRLVLRAVLARLRLLALLGGTLALAACWRDVLAQIQRWSAPAAPDLANLPVEYFCPMHPGVTSSSPGRCPACAMPLSRASARAASGTAGPARIELGPDRVAQAGIRTEAVTWRPLTREIRAGGLVRYDETRTRSISLGFAALVTSVERCVEGASVPRGTPLLRVSSAALAETWAAYATSRKALRDAEDRAASAATERLRGQTEGLRRQLVDAGLTADQIDADRPAAGPPGDDIPIVAPFDCIVVHLEATTGEVLARGAPLVHVADPAAVVAVLDVRRIDAPLLRPGVPARVFDPAAPCLSRSATVAAVAPYADDASQTVAVRLALAPDPAPFPIPGSRVAGVVVVPVADIDPWRAQSGVPSGPPREVYECPMHRITRDAPGVCEACGGMKLIPRTFPGGPAPGEVLAIPRGALVATGDRSYVFVEVTTGVFEAREVVVGPRSGSYFPVISGIAPGERVAAAGAFLLDAETRLDPAAAGSYFGASDAPEHGSRR